MRGLTHTLERDLAVNEERYREKRKQIDNFGAHQGHTRKFLGFDWKIIEERSRSTRPARLPNRSWKPLWWLRQLLPSR